MEEILYRSRFIFRYSLTVVRFQILKIFLEICTSNFQKKKNKCNCNLEKTNELFNDMSLFYIS